MRKRKRKWLSKSHASIAPISPNTTIHFPIINIFYCDSCYYGLNPITAIIGKRDDRCHIDKNPACYFAETGILDSKYPITRQNVNKPITWKCDVPIGRAAYISSWDRFSYLVDLGADPKLICNNNLYQRYDPTSLYERLTGGCTTSDRFAPMSDAEFRQSIYFFTYAAFERAGVIPDYDRLLVTAVRHTCIPPAQYAIAHGANIKALNSLNESGYAPLHYLVWPPTEPNLITVRFIIGLGIDTSIKSKAGITPYESFKERYAHELAAIEKDIRNQHSDQSEPSKEIAFTRKAYLLSPKGPYKLMENALLR